MGVGRWALGLGFRLWASAEANRYEMAFVAAMKVARGSKPMAA